MSRSFALYLVAAGTASAMVMAFPIIVVFGLMLGILPGIILSFTPSWFCYSLAWWVAYAVVMRLAARAGIATATRLSRVAVGLCAASIVVIPATLLARALSTPVHETVQALRAADQDAAHSISFPAVVAIELPDGHDARDALSCEGLCQRLLYNRAVSRVVMVEAPPPGRVARIKPTAYWIERRDTCPPPALARREIVWPAVDFPRRRGEDLRSRVLARIAAGECLVQEKAQSEAAGATISYRKVKDGKTMFEAPWSLSVDTIEANRLEIVEAGGRVLYRRTEVTAMPLTVPLQIATAAAFLTSVTYVGWARSRIEEGPLGPNGRDVLPSLLGDAARVPDRPAP